MPKQPFLLSALLTAATAIALLPGSTTAQRGRPAAPAAPRLGGPAPLPGLPVTPPPTDHPALLGQPLIGDSKKPRKANQPKPPEKAKPGVPPKLIGPPPPVVRKSGSEVKKAVQRLEALTWHDDLDDARKAAADTGRPILWLQTLGDLTGLASSIVQSLRAVTLADEDVLAMLEHRFVLGQKNLDEPGSGGMTMGYRATNDALSSTNGAGGRSVQFVVMAGDGTVLHALPGYWHAEDLVPELQLALEIGRLYREASMSEQQKLAMFAALHKAHLRRYGLDAERRGQWPELDRKAELDRIATEKRDTFHTYEDGSRELKAIPDLVHDRLLARPFKQLGAFDMPSFVDYGRLERN